MMANANDTREPDAPANNATPGDQAAANQLRAAYGNATPAQRTVFADGQITGLVALTMEEAEAHAKAEAKAQEAKRKRMSPFKRPKEKAATKPGKPQTDRFLTVTTMPGNFANMPWIRLAGQWLAQAGFSVRTRVRVHVEAGRLIITPEEEDATA
jgi:hypothetical protein